MSRTRPGPGRLPAEHVTPPVAGAQVYLAHLEPRLAHAGHYLGTSEDVAHREQVHTSGNGSRLVAAAVAAGSRVQIVRTWPGGYALERTFKKGRGRPGKGTRNTTGCRGGQTSYVGLCPVCTEPAQARRRRPQPGQWLLGDTGPELLPPDPDDEPPF